MVGKKVARRRCHIQSRHILAKLMTEPAACKQTIISNQETIPCEDVVIAISCAHDASRQRSKQSRLSREVFKG